MNSELPQEGITSRQMHRRSFLRTTGGILGAAGLMAVSSCSKSHTTAPVNDYDAGSGDDGVFNFLYANEQLLAAFYIAVFTTPYKGMTGDELKYMSDIHDHDIIHRDFFQEFLGSKSFPILNADFSAVDFTDRTAVLATAKTLKHNSIAAYSSVAYLLKDAAYLTLLGKIASVEGRHASTLGSLLSYGSILDATCVDPATSLELSRSPAEVLSVINSYLTTKITAANL